MSFIAKPKVANPSLPRNELGLNRRDYEGSMSTLCAGCGHDSVTAAIVQACFELALPPRKGNRHALRVIRRHREDAPAGMPWRERFSQCIEAPRSLRLRAPHDDVADAQTDGRAIHAASRRLLPDALELGLNGAGWHRQELVDDALNGAALHRRALGGAVYIRCHSRPSRSVR